MGCSMPVQPNGLFYLHLQSDTNLVLHAGTSMFDNRGYVYDFRTNVAASPSLWGKIVSSIKTAVGCR